MGGVSEIETERRNSVDGRAGVPVVRFGRRLRRLRHARGKSLAVIAGLAGISQAYLSCVELGIRSAYRLPLIVRLAAALEVSPRELVLLALGDYLAYGEGARSAEAGRTARTRTGRCLACPVSFPGGGTCAGECGDERAQ